MVVEEALVNNPREVDCSRESDGAIWCYQDSQKCVIMVDCIFFQWKWVSPNHDVRDNHCPLSFSHSNRLSQRWNKTMQMFPTLNP